MGEGQSIHSQGEFKFNYFITMNILIDFTGTCVLYNYPNRGADVKDAQVVLEELVQQGHRLILFNMRGEGEEELQDAVNWFRERGIKLFAVLMDKPELYGDLIISTTTPNAPIVFNPHISPEPYINWKQLRQVLVQMNYLKQK